MTIVRYESGVSLKTCRRMEDVGFVQSSDVDLADRIVVADLVESRLQRAVYSKGS